MKTIMTLEQYRDFRSYVRTGLSPFIIKGLEFMDLPEEAKATLEILDITYPEQQGIANVILKKDSNQPQVFGLGWGVSVAVDIDSRTA